MSAVAVFGVAVGSIAGVADAEWNQEYDSLDPVDSSGFLDIAATPDGAAFILGYHSGDFESLSAGLQYSPFVQFRDVDGDVVWTAGLDLDETCTTTTPREASRGITTDEEAVFAFTTCSGDHIVTAAADGIVAVRSFERDPEADAEEYVNPLFVVGVDPAGGAHLLSSEERVVDGGADELVVTQFDRLLETSSITSVASELELAPGAPAPESLYVDAHGSTLLVTVTAPPLAHLEGEGFVVAVSADGSTVSSTSIGAVECTPPRILLARDDVRIVNCRETAEFGYYGDNSEHRLDVYETGDFSEPTASYALDQTGPSLGLVSMLAYGLASVSTDGSTLGDGSGRYFRVSGDDPAFWTDASLAGPSYEEDGRNMRSFDVIGNDVIEVGIASDPEHYYFDDDVDFAVEGLVSAPHAFIARSSFPTLAAIESARFVDTRTGGVTFDGEEQGAGRLAAGSITEIQIAGRGGVPDGSVAVFANLTAVGPAANGYITAFPCGSERPDASSLNHRNRTNAGNNTLATLSNDGSLCVYSSAATDLVIDIGGFYGPGDELGPLTPARLLDTRPGGATVDGIAVGGGQRASGVEIAVPVTGRGGVPVEATEVVVNLSTVASSGVGFAVAYACGSDVAGVSAINYGPGAVSNNLAIVEIGDNGSICFKTSRPTDLTVDVTAWLGDDSTLDTSTQSRVLDTRAWAGQEIPPNLPEWERDCCRIGPDDVQYFDLGYNEFGESVGAGLVNVTAIDPSANGFVSIIACDDIGADGVEPTTSVLNFTAGVTSGNTALLQGSDPYGYEYVELCVHASASTHLVIDVIANG